MLTDQVKVDLVKVASDKQVQLSCIRAMFQECERGTDLWEWLEGDAETFQPETRKLLWGSEVPFEDGEEETAECLYTSYPPHEVIGYLLDRVEENLSSKLGAK